MVRIKAFTLIELVVVVAILAILMGLLFPVFVKAKQQGYITQDVQQMRQVYIATELYREDSSDEYPHSLLYTAPYASSHGVYVSPVDPFRNGILEVKDFPADMYTLPDANTGASLRSSFRISYGYLYPMAIFYGESDAWFRSAVSNPANGLISMKMYNEIAQDQFPNFGVDLCRWDRTDYRIRIDGSFYEYQYYDGVSLIPSLNFCFGPGLPIDTWLGGPGAFGN